jgi:hypothetical protein
VKPERTQIRFAVTNVVSTALKTQTAWVFAHDSAKGELVTRDHASQRTSQDIVINQNNK